MGIQSMTYNWRHIPQGDAGVRCVSNGFRVYDDMREVGGDGRVTFNGKRKLGEVEKWKNGWMYLGV